MLDSGTATLIVSSDRNHAIAVDRHLRYVLRRLPRGPQPLQVVVRDPPGPAARPSRVDRNLVLQGERDELLQRRDADWQHALRDYLARQHRRVSREDDLWSVAGLDGAFGEEEGDPRPRGVLRAVGRDDQHARHRSLLPYLSRPFSTTGFPPTVMEAPPSCAANPKSELLLPPATRSLPKMTATAPACGHTIAPVVRGKETSGLRPMSIAPNRSLPEPAAS